MKTNTFWFPVMCDDTLNKRQSMATIYLLIGYLLNTASLKLIHTYLLVYVMLSYAIMQSKTVIQTKLLWAGNNV